MNTKQKILLFLILIISAFLRFYNLDKIPPHLSNDEISIAYDAYSVSKTLRDEHNHFLPVSFQSHGTYKAPLAIYLAVPTTIILGNSEYGVRLPSAIFGVLTIFLVSLLVFELTKNSFLSLFAGFSLGVAPWHIYCSRMALESNIALFFVVAGVYLFFRALRAASFFLFLLSFFSFALSVYGYHTEWVFTPLLIIFLVFLYFKIWPKKSVFLLGFLFFSFLVMPVFIDYLHNLNTYARANTEVIFKEPSLNKALTGRELNYFQKALLLIGAFLGNYSQYTNLGYLFFNGLNLMPQDDPFHIGLFLPIFLPAFIFGFLQIKSLFKTHALFIYFWLLISPVVPALTIGGPNMVRNLVSVIPYTIVISAGSYSLWNFFKKKWIKFAAIPMVFGVLFAYFFLIYYRNFPINSGEGFQYGYKQIALFIKEHYLEYQKIVIDPKFGEGRLYVGVPHLYISYFTYLDPQKFLNERKDLPSGLYFDKYEIRDINWIQEKITSLTLYVVPHSNLPPAALVDQLKNVKKISLPNGRPAFSLYSSQLK